MGRIGKETRSPSPLWHQVHRLVYCSTTDTSYLLQNIVVVHQCAAAPRITGCRDSTSDQNLYFHETDQLLLRSRKIFHASFANIELATPSMHHVSAKLIQCARAHTTNTMYHNLPGPLWRLLPTRIRLNEMLFFLETFPVKYDNIPTRHDTTEQN